MSTVVPVDADLNGTTAIDEQSMAIEVEPTVDELNTLEHISDRIPFTAWLIIFCGLCDGFAEYGTFEIFQNYIQFPAPDPGNQQPGALNRGQQMATAMTTSYYLYYNLTPIAAALIADQFWGKYKTIVVSCFIYFTGLIVLVVTSIPISIKAGVALPGLILAMIILGAASGGLKSTIGPFMTEQYTRTTAVIKEVNGKKKIIDPEITVQSLISKYYWAIYVGALMSTFTTTSVEKYHSYWLAYLIPAIVFPGFIVLLLIGHRRYVQVPPTGSLIARAFRVTSTAISNRWKLGKQPNNKHLLDYAKGAVPPNEREAATAQNENLFINSLKQVIDACRVFAFFPIYWICYNQVFGNLKSQAAQMNVGPVPNDVLANITSFVIVIFVPIFDNIIYPTLRRCNIKLSPIARITCGLFVMSLAMAWTTIIQHLIYSTGPNFDYATEQCSNCQTFNNLTVAWQIPSCFLIGISEILVSITGLEYALTNAPSTMKTIVMALFFLAIAIGSALNLTLLPVSVDPKLLWMYASLSIVIFIIGIIFYIVFRNDEKQSLPKHEQSHRRSSLNIIGYW